MSALYSGPTVTTVPKSESEADRLEREHVHQVSSPPVPHPSMICFFVQVYNQIAHNFSDTRHTPWPRVVDFLRTFSPGSFVLDVGCGNGKYMNTRNDLVMVKNPHRSSRVRRRHMSFSHSRLAAIEAMVSLTSVETVSIKCSFPTA